VAESNGTDTVTPDATYDEWPEVLAPYIVSGPDINGEYKAHCPLHEDHNPSASFNFGKGLGICYSQCGGFQLDDLRWKARDAYERWQAGGAGGWPESAYWAPWNRESGARSGSAKNGPEPLPNAGKVAGWHEYLKGHPDLGKYLTEQRGLTTETVRNRKIGYDQTKRAYTIPIYDAAGRLANVRYYKPKTPRMKRAGRWGVTGHNERRLYPVDVMESATSLVICAGEWDTLLLNQHGIPAVTSTGGEGSWNTEWNEQFRGKAVAVVYDCDQTGRTGATTVTDQLATVASELRVVDLDPDRTDGYDITDWFVRDRRSADDLKALLEQAPPTAADGFPHTDYGNAERLVARHGENLRYCPPWKRWLIWDGKRWCHDETQEIERLAKDSIRHLDCVAEGIEDAKKRDRLIAFARRSEANARLKAMIDLAESEPSMPVRPKQLDEAPMLLNVLNGTIDLTTGTLREHRRSDLLTKLVPVAYDPKTDCPRWKKFLARVLPGEELQIFIQRALGYSLTGLTSEQVAFLLYGRGDNGKSKFLGAAEAMLGTYTQTASSDLLLTKRQGGATNDVARLQGARFVSMIETDEGRHLAEGLFKQLTGQDTVSARFLYGEFFDFTPVCKLWLATNHKPEIKDMTHAMWRRIHLVPFTVQIPKSEQDKNLDRKLAFELPGILRWAVEGCLAWQREGLAVPAAVREATEDYRSEMDVFGLFLEDNCVEGPQLTVPAAKLYARYRSWCENQGVRNPMTQNKFGRQLTERGFERGRAGAERVHIWRGIGLLHGDGPNALHLVRTEDDR